MTNNAVQVLLLVLQWCMFERHATSPATWFRAACELTFVCPALWQQLLKMAEFVQICEGYEALDGAPDMSSLKGIVYFGNRLCPFAHRAWWALCEKGLDSEIRKIHINLGDSKPAWYQESVNELGTVPFVVVDGQPIFESSIVSSFFDENFPDKGTQLMPADALRRAQARFVSARFGGCIGAMYRLLKNQDPEQMDAIKQAVREALVAFNTFVAKHSSGDGPYLVGSTFSMADIDVIPFLDRFQHTLSHYRQFEILPDDGKHDRLRQALAACQERPAFKSKFPFTPWQDERLTQVLSYISGRQLLHSGVQGLRRRHCVACQFIQPQAWEERGSLFA